MDTSRKGISFGDHGWGVWLQHSNLSRKFSFLTFSVNLIDSMGYLLLTNDYFHDLLARTLQTIIYRSIKKALQYICSFILSKVVLE